MAESPYIPTSSFRRFPFLQVSRISICTHLKYDGHSDQCEVVPHCSFNLHFSNHLAVLSIFSRAYWPSVCPPWKNIYLATLLIFCLGCFFILSHMNCLYILEMKPLSVALFANIFSHRIGCHFVYGFLCYAKAFQFD